MGRLEAERPLRREKLRAVEKARSPSPGGALSPRLCLGTRTARVPQRCRRVSCNAPNDLQRGTVPPLFTARGCELCAAFPGSCSWNQLQDACGARPVGLPGPIRARCGWPDQPQQVEGPAVPDAGTKPGPLAGALTPWARLTLGVRAGHRVTAKKSTKDSGQVGARRPRGAGVRPFAAQHAVRRRERDYRPSLRHFENLLCSQIPGRELDVSSTACH